MELPHTHPFLTEHTELEALIEPLSKYGINYFSYRKFYVDHSRIFLGTRPDWIKRYFAEEFYLEDNTEAEPRFYYRQAVLWSSLPNQKVFETCRTLGIDHGIYLVHPTADYCEFFAFAASPENRGVVNFYLNNVGILENFVSYFRNQAEPLLKKAEQSKIVLPYHQPQRPIESYKTSDVVDFHNYLLAAKERQLRISKRQRDCIDLLLTGATTKEMAMSLKLSYRTVEDYVNFLKQKFQARNKSELILKLAAIFPREA